MFTYKLNRTQGRISWAILLLWLISGMCLAQQDISYPSIRYKLKEVDFYGNEYPIEEGLPKQVVDVEAQLTLSLEALQDRTGENEARTDKWKYFPRTDQINLPGPVEITVKGLILKENGKVVHLPISGYDMLQNQEMALNWKLLIDEIDITIDLGTDKWKANDRIAIDLLIRDAASKTLLDTVSFFAKAEMIGLYHLFTTGMVFSRPEKGEDREWKSNIMTQINWYYDFREPKSAGRVWNWLGMGAGLHLASLDHSEDNNVEFGIGGNISFWEGLLSVGMGYNLSVEQDHSYHFITIDLFDILDGKSGD